MSLCRNFFSKKTQGENSRKHKGNASESKTKQKCDVKNGEEEREEEEEEEDELIQPLKKSRQAIIESDSEGESEDAKDEKGKEEEMETNSAVVSPSPVTTSHNVVAKTPPKRATG